MRSVQSRALIFCERLLLFLKAADFIAVLSHLTKNDSRRGCWWILRDFCELLFYRITTMLLHNLYVLSTTSRNFVYNIQARTLSNNLRSCHQRCSVRQRVLRNFEKFTGKPLCQSLFLIKLQRPATLLKKRLWHRCFPVNFAKFLRTPFI